MAYSVLSLARRIGALLLLAGVLAGCTAVSCPDEFARPTSRETFCGRSAAS